MSKQDLDSMTPHELTAGLMRGNRVDMQLGYGPYAAAMTAADRHKLSDASVRSLFDWALGFHDGIHDAMHRDDDDVEEGPKRPGMAENETYLTGRVEGRSESGLYLYPSAPEPTPREFERWMAERG